MKTAKRISIAVIAFIFATIYALPNVALMFAVSTVFISKYISLIACFIFAWNIAKIVESAYKEYLDDTKRKDDDADVRDEVESMDTREQKEWVEGEGYSYYIEDDEITFQFRNIKDHDGRQLNRLKFMREKFFKDK
jgi:hypothetical protein